MARGILAAIVLLAGACSPSSSPAPTAAPIDSAPSAPPIDVSCTSDPVAPAYLGDPCPEATLAAELAVAPVRLPIARVVVEPGPFFCDVVWPGVESPVPCYGPAVQPGQYMHAWVTFTDSPRVAAVMLGRDLPTEIGSPLPSPPSWAATLVKVEVPPAGWKLP